MKYKMKYNKEMHQSCERDKIVKNPWIAIKYRSSIKGQWRRKEGRNIFYFTGGSCDHVAMLSWRMWMWRQDNKTRGEKMRMCPHWQINLHQQLSSGRKMETPRPTSQSTISSTFGGWRNVKPTCVHCVFSIQEPICSPSQIVNIWYSEFLFRRGSIDCYSSFVCKM